MADLTTLQDDAKDKYPPADPVVAEVYDGSQRYPVTWYRSTVFNTVVVATATFMGVGMFTALQNTGAGGLQDVTTGGLGS
jgi:hypothetical protein